MQNSNNSASLSTALKEWFDNLKPLYSNLNSLVKHDKLSSGDCKNIIPLMKEASIACQKVSDTEYELQNLSGNLDKWISNLEKQKTERAAELSELETNKNKNQEDVNQLRGKIEELSGQLQHIIEKVDVLSDEQENLIAETEKKKEEDFQLEQAIKEKNSLLKDITNKVAQKESEYQKYLNGYNDDIERKDIIEEQDRYKYSKAKVEIMEMLVSILTKEAPQLNQVWNLLEEIIYTYDIDVIHEKIRGIKSAVTSLDFSAAQTNPPVKEVETPQEIEAASVPIDNSAELEKQKLESDIDLLKQSVALLGIEQQSRKRKSDELTSRIEEKNYAVQKMEQYQQELKNNITAFENQYNKLSDTFSLLNKSEGLTENLSHLSHFNREYYFDEYYNKIQIFYKENKERIDSELAESYEKLRNIEKLIDLRQKELNIIEERINKEYPNYELKIANLQLRLQRKDKDIEILNASVAENIDKMNKMDSEVSVLKTEQKAFEEERFELTKRINDLEIDIRNKIDEIQNLNYSVKDSEIMIKKFEDQNKLLNEQLSVQSVKSKGYESLLADYKAQLEKSDSELSELKSKLEELESSISVYSEKLTYAEEMSFRKDDDIAETKSNLKQAEESNIELIDENGNYRKEIKRLQAVLDEKINEEDRLRLELAQLSKRKNEGERAILELEKVNTSLASQIRRRENLLEELEGENRILKEKIKENSETVK